MSECGAAERYESVIVSQCAQFEFVFWDKDGWNFSNVYTGTHSTNFADKNIGSGEIYGVRSKLAIWNWMASAAIGLYCVDRRMRKKDRRPNKKTKALNIVKWKKVRQNSDAEVATKKIWGWIISKLLIFV